jgi:hypothetical protein
MAKGIVVARKGRAITTLELNVKMSAVGMSGEEEQASGLPMALRQAYRLARERAWAMQIAVADQAARVKFYEGYQTAGATLDGGAALLERIRVKAMVQEEVRVVTVSFVVQLEGQEAAEWAGPHAGRLVYLDLGVGEEHDDCESTREVAGLEREAGPGGDARGDAGDADDARDRGSPGGAG